MYGIDHVFYSLRMPLILPPKDPPRSSHRFVEQAKLGSSINSQSGILLIIDEAWDAIRSEYSFMSLLPVKCVYLSSLDPSCTFPNSVSALTDVELHQIQNSITHQMI